MLLASTLHTAGVTCAAKNLHLPAFPLCVSSFYLVEIKLKSRVAALDKGNYTEPPAAKGKLTSQGQGHLMTGD